ncbi:MAG: protein-L-isoaspartate(D-aspartate) O-methyltransferase [Betaproteobacteria bacterium]|jgi:protein-L-isoaspartate(D-aspartate) O-methyltransferase|nr:protein-L-isoaspartate(D-aspartate) O-methyltransferase [Betaproteobacteria bacterium]NBT66189.1 protein-L-isoaspartate(D-aspartate) O-methyltransferase [Betaproteobacteria bacterium]NBY07394.1 protein-L-isoaspartate(D-aspartate) O-methyltransferase [Betaproteobacteria bacterium]
MKKRPGFPLKLEQFAPPKPVKTHPDPYRQLPKDLIAKPSAPMESPTGIGLDSSAVRARMVAKLEAQGIDDAMVLDAMGKIERHRFVDSALVNQAYEDTSLPIGLGQTISKPNVVARMISLLRQGRNLMITGKLGRILEIGTGCGYQAALLSCVAKEVHSIERLKGLHEKARENLRPMRIANLQLILGDGMLGYSDCGPYSGIISAAGGESLPQAWIDQLAVGGRIVAPMVNSNGSQYLLVIDKTPHGIEQQQLEPVHFVPLKSGLE